MNKREIEQNENIERLQRDLSILDATVDTILIQQTETVKIQKTLSEGFNKMMSRLSTIESDISRFHSRISNFEDTYLNVLYNDVSKHTKEEKIYAVEFNSYTNALNNVVSNGDEDIGRRKYIHIPDGGLLVKESELDEYRKYGNGFASTKFVGTILTEE